MAVMVNFIEDLKLTFRNRNKSRRNQQHTYINSAKEKRYNNNRTNHPNKTSRYLIEVSFKAVL